MKEELLDLETSFVKEANMFDYVIKNPLVLDGTGIPWYQADIGILDGKIATISETSDIEGERTIDAEGLALCPGFVDMHTHADVSYLSDPCARSLVHQGVTLALMGNCGNSPAPLNDEIKKAWQQRLPWGEERARSSITWSTFEEYMRNAEKSKFSVNVAAQVGHNAVRAHAMGHYTKKVRPSSAEMEQMRSSVEEAMRAGAFGMSSGLMYIPGFYSETEELIELCRIVAKYGGIYSTHMRGEANELLQSVEEVIRIAETSKVSAHIGHHRAECRINWGLIRHTLRMMEEANRRGANVTCDFFPYTACGVGGGIPLPRWASPLYMPKHEAMKLIKDPETRKRIKDQVKLGTRLGSEVRSYEPIENPEDVVITIYPGHPELQGKSVAELARIGNYDDPYEFFLDTVSSDRTFGVLSFDVWEEDVRTLVRSPLAMIGTDSSFADDINQPNRHPRAYGSYARVLGRYVRDERLTSWEEAVMKMSSRPHAKLGIHDRGLVRPGFCADLVLFNPSTVMDTADYSGKAAYPEGIEYVFVNGELVISGGRHTRATPGRLLRQCQH